MSSQIAHNVTIMSISEHNNYHLEPKLTLKFTVQIIQANTCMNVQLNILLSQGSPATNVR